MLAGALVRRPGGVSFIYEPDYRRAGGPAVAFTLPLSDKPVDGASPGAVPPLFAGLLPEGRRPVAPRLGGRSEASRALYPGASHTSAASTRRGGPPSSSRTSNAPSSSSPIAVAVLASSGAPYSPILTRWPITVERDR